MPLPTPAVLGLLVGTAVLPPLSLMPGDALTVADPARDTRPSAVARAPGSPGRPPPGVTAPTTIRSATPVWPLSPRPRVVSGFSPPLSTYGAGHRGVDLAGTPGQPVRAAAEGRVTYAGLLAGRGVVVVSHGATRTTYEPVRAEVRVGDAVAAGSVLGTLERSAGHCAPATCLHWGLIQGSTYLDPLTLVYAAPVRLLPLAPGPRAAR